MVSARPMTALAWAVPRSWSTGQQLLRVVSDLFTTFSAPLVAFTLHATALWVWHLPVLYERAIGNNWIHGVEHACFLMTACALLTVLALALFAAWLGELERRNAQSRLSAFTQER